MDGWLRSLKKGSEENVCGRGVWWEETQEEEECAGLWFARCMAEPLSCVCASYLYPEVPGDASIEMTRESQEAGLCCMNKEKVKDSKNDAQRK